jgi:hypothetical protein
MRGGGGGKKSCKKGGSTASDAVTSLVPAAAFEALSKNFSNVTVSGGAGKSTKKSACKKGGSIASDAVTSLVPAAAFEALSKNFSNDHVGGKAASAKRPKKKQPASSSPKQPKKQPASKPKSAKSAKKRGGATTCANELVTIDLGRGLDTAMIARAPLASGTAPPASAYPSVLHRDLSVFGPRNDVNWSLNNFRDVAGQFSIDNPASLNRWF